MKKFFDMYEDALISAIFFISLITMILCTSLLLNAHSKLEEEIMKKKTTNNNLFKKTIELL